MWKTIILIIGGVLFSLRPAGAVIINEIGAYEKDGYEWVEIFNEKDEAQDMTEWRFFEDGTNHKLDLAGEEYIILDPGEYAIIADVADKFKEAYPSFSGKVIDSAWGTLKEEGEEIGLRDVEGIDVELFTYVEAKDFSLERCDNGWMEHPDGNSIGEANLCSQRTEEPADETVIDHGGKEEEAAGSADKEEVLKGDTLPIEPKKEYSDRIRISEIYPNPSGSEEEEFIELLNWSIEPADLEGWKVSDASGRVYEIKKSDFESVEIGPAGFFVLPRAITKIALNNNGEEVNIFSPDGKLVHKMGYEGKAKEGYSYALGDLKWYWTATPTMGKVNIIDDPEKQSLASPLSEKKEEMDKKNEGGKNVPVPVDPSSAGVLSKEKDVMVKMARVRELSGLKKGELVTTFASVLVPPGVLGTQVFYVGDGQAGIQVYMYKKDFPPLEYGDVIQLNAEMSESGGELRLKIKEKDDIAVIGHEEIPPLDISCEAAGEEMKYLLVRLEGDVLEKKGNGFYLDDGTSASYVYINKYTGIDKKGINNSDRISLVGLILPYNGQYRILPRSGDDIVILKRSEDGGAPDKPMAEAAGTIEKWEIEGRDKKARTMDYLAITLALFLAIFLGIFIREYLDKKKAERGIMPAPE